MSVAEKTPELSVADLVRRSEALRRELVPHGVRVDTLGCDTAEALQRCFEEGLNLLSVPRQYGGLSDGDAVFGAEAFTAIATNLGATDGALAQNWGTTQLMAREIFHNSDKLPEATLRKLADDLVNKGARIVSSVSETGSPKPLTAEIVPGGVRLNGVKTFNTNSGGDGYAIVGFRHAEMPGRNFALVPLDSEGVRKHGDWDNMGQRGTQSQAITYDNVFVPDAWRYNTLAFDARTVPLAFLLHSVVIMGSAYGALDAAVDFLRSTNRVILGGEFKGSEQDPLMMRRLGSLSSKLRAAYVLQQKVAADLEQLKEGEDVGAVQMDAFRNKAVCVETALEVTQGLFDMTGARTTANKHRFDRFWRNARTFACHDPVDILNVVVGRYEFSGEPSNFFKTYAHLGV